MSYTLEKWIKPSNSICLNVTFLHFILCLIYYILSGGGKKKIRGQIAGCGLLLRCMNKSRVYDSRAVCFAAKPHPAHTEIGLAISSSGKRRFCPPFSAAGHGAPCLGHLAWSLGKRRGVGRELVEVWWHFQKIKKTSKCFPSKVAGHLLEGEKQCLSSGLSQDWKTLIPMLQILCYKREGWHSNLRSLSLFIMNLLLSFLATSACAWGGNTEPPVSGREHLQGRKWSTSLSSDGWKYGTWRLGENNNNHAIIIINWLIAICQTPS